MTETTDRNDELRRAQQKVRERARTLGNAVGKYNTYGQEYGFDTTKDPTNPQNNDAYVGTYQDLLDRAATCGLSESDVQRQYANGYREGKEAAMENIRQDRRDSSKATRSDRRREARNQPEEVISPEEARERQIRNVLAEARSFGYSVGKYDAWSKVDVTNPNRDPRKNQSLDAIIDKGRALGINPRRIRQYYDDGLSDGEQAATKEISDYMDKEIAKARAREKQPTTLTRREERQLERQAEKREEKKLKRNDKTPKADNDNTPPEEPDPGAPNTRPPRDESKDTTARPVDSDRDVISRTPDGERGDRNRDDRHDSGGTNPGGRRTEPSVRRTKPWLRTIAFDVQLPTEKLANWQGLTLVSVDSNEPPLQTPPSAAKSSLKVLV